MLIEHEDILWDLENQLQANPKALIFFDPIAEGLHNEAHYQEEQKVRIGNYGDFKTLSDGTVLERTYPEDGHDRH